MLLDNIQKPRLAPARRWLATFLLAVTFSTSLLAQNRRIREHEVQREETVYSIAKRYGASIDKIYELNPWARQQIKVGDKLLIPTATATSSSQTPTSQKGRKHRIEAGETLYSISRSYGIDLALLLRANPGVTSSNIQVGQEITIPAATAQADSPVTKAPESPTTITTPETVTPSPVAVAQTRVLMLLPLERKDKQYLEFFEGFLLGMYDLKKQGISIQLTTLEVPNDQALRAYIEQGRLQGKDLVFGGVTEGQIRAIASASGYGSYIIPFGKTNSLETGDGRVILTNAPSSLIIERAVSAFLHKYPSGDVVFARRSTDQEDHFATALRSALQQAGRSYGTIDPTQGRPSFGANTVVVPASPDRSLAQATMNALTRQPAGVSLFGYPQWQAYGTQFQQALHRYNTTIYSTFFFDPMQTDAKEFLTEFNRWFSHKISNSYPKYSLLGYDLARYFIRAHSLYGNNYVQSMASLPSDGLQLDLYLQHLGSGNLYANSRFYFVNYLPSGATVREAH